MIWEWKNLEQWMKADPTCEACPKAARDAEIKNILAAAKSTYKTRTTCEGCISISTRLITNISLKIPGATVASGMATGALPAGLTTTRLWMEVDTPCYKFELVARWTLEFRHQAVLCLPKCKPNAYDWFGSTVIDPWWLVVGKWRPWHRWARGKNQVDVTCGRVKDGF